MKKLLRTCKLLCFVRVARLKKTRVAERKNREFHRFLIVLDIRICTKKRYKLHPLREPMEKSIHGP